MGRAELDKSDYRQRIDALLFESFGWSDAYAIEFRKLGCEADTLIVGAPELQRQWATEQGLSAVVREWKLLDQAKWLAERSGVGLSAINQRQKALLNEVFLAQVKHYRPDILLIQLQTPLAASTIRAAKGYSRFVVGQLASRFPAYLDLFGVYDLIVSAFPHYVRLFNETGLRSCYLPLAFEPVFIERCRQRYGDVQDGVVGRSYQAVFVGSVSDMHAERLHWLSSLAETGLVDIWLSYDRGKESASLPKVLRERSQEAVYGLEMYDVYRRARIALNAHPEISGPYAAILRLYETTGSGCMLLTDERENLGELFVPGVEVAAYSSIDDCIAKLSYYIAHEEERAGIAQRGQQRTYSEHLFEHRAAQFLHLVEPML